MSRPMLPETHPEIAAQWSPRNERSVGTVSRGVDTKFWWVGACGHEWDDSVSHRVAGRGCPFCSATGRKRVLPGVNSLAVKRQEVAALWDSTRNSVSADEVAPFSTSDRQWLCPKCSFAWTAPPSTTKGCPACSGQVVVAGINSLWDTRPDLAKQMLFPDPALISQGSDRDAVWICDSGHSCAMSGLTVARSFTPGTACRPEQYGHPAVLRL